MAQLPGAPCLPESREQYPRERKGDLLNRHTAVSPEKRHVPPHGAFLFTTDARPRTRNAPLNQALCRNVPSYRETAFSSKRVGKSSLIGKAIFEVYRRDAEAQSSA
jgi:hypothetical protein